MPAVGSRALLHINHVIVTRPKQSTWDNNTWFADVKANRVRRAADKLMFADAMQAQLQPHFSNHYYIVPRYDDATFDGEANYVAYRHSPQHDLINACMWDGHCETMARNELAAVIDADSLEERYSFRAHDDDITAMAFHPTLPILATAANDGTLKLGTTRRPTSAKLSWESTGPP